MERVFKMSNDSSIALFNKIDAMAEAFAKSRIFNQPSKDAWAALMFIAHAEGRHPASVANEYHFINGKPTLRSEVILARFLAAGGKIRWLHNADDRVSVEVSHPQGGEIVIDWDMKRAAAAKLATKDTWKSFPQQMMRARAVAEGVRAVYPVVLSGFYAKEEADHLEDLPQHNYATAPILEVERFLTDDVMAEYIEAIQSKDNVEDLRSYYAHQWPMIKANASAAQAEELNKSMTKRAAELKAVTVEVANDE